MEETEIGDDHEDADDSEKDVLGYIPALDMLVGKFICLGCCTYRIDSLPNESDKDKSEADVLHYFDTGLFFTVSYIINFLLFAPIGGSQSEPHLGNRHSCNQSYVLLCRELKHVKDPHELVASTVHD